MSEREDSDEIRKPTTEETNRLRGREHQTRDGTPVLRKVSSPEGGNESQDIGMKQEAQHRRILLSLGPLHNKCSI
jgi:hypothetical protein